MSLSEKLPAIGSTLRNRHNIEWTVADHIRASSIATKPGDESELTCYPVFFPENLSERLNEFLAEVARCTPKVILPLDTMPRVFPTRAHVGGHSIDAWSHPEAIHIFVDAEDCSEVVFAHELAHAWIDFVKDIEDHRVWNDRKDTARYTQVQLMQSFVLDFAVDQALEEKGFDQSQIRADWEVASMQLRVAGERGYRPENPREAIYMASHLAAVLVEESVSTLPVPLANSLPVVKRNLPEIFGRATGLAEAVSNNFPADRESALKAIDSVLEQSFAFTDPDLDYASHLPYVELAVNWERDKTPDWLKGQPVRAKCEIGVVMARLGATSADTPMLVRENDLLQIRFKRQDGSITESVKLTHAVVPPRSGDEVRRANERIEEMRQAKKMLEDVRKMTEPKQSATMPEGPLASPAPMPGTPMQPSGPNIPGFRPRSYSPGMARWLTRVRMDEMLAGEHPYAYGGDNPSTFIDPSGNQHGRPQRSTKKWRRPVWNLQDALELADDLCGTTKPNPSYIDLADLMLQCKGVNDQLPICTSSNPNWDACGRAIIGTNPPTGGSANFSNWPRQQCQVKQFPEPFCWIGAEYCCIECKMRVCCAFGPYPYEPGPPRPEPPVRHVPGPILPGQPVRLGSNPIWQ